MSASLDKTVQVVEVGALIELDDSVLSHGVGIISAEYPPLLLRFLRDDKGEVTGYEIEPIKSESPEVQRINFVKVGRVLEKRPAIIGLNGKGPKIIMPG